MIWLDFSFKVPWLWVITDPKSVPRIPNLMQGWITWATKNPNLVHLMSLVANLACIDFRNAVENASIHIGDNLEFWLMSNINHINEFGVYLKHVLWIEFNSKALTLDIKFRLIGFVTSNIWFVCNVLASYIWIGIPCSE